MNGHHLVLGNLQDFISGRIIPDTHDERYRQKIARYLVTHLGYTRNEIETAVPLVVKADDKSASIKIDFAIHLMGKIAMMIKYAPGSLVTRRRPALSASRLISRYQIPLVVVTNGKDAEILDGVTGNVISQGLDTVPIKKDLLIKLATMTFHPIKAHQAEMESRILYAFEVDDSCPCDDNICRL